MIMKLIIMNCFIAVVTGCSNVRVDANVEPTDQRDIGSDSATTYFQARTMELDRKMFHGSSSHTKQKGFFYFHHMYKHSQQQVVKKLFRSVLHILNGSGNRQFRQ